MTKIWFINCVNENRKTTVGPRYSGLGLSYIASYIREYGGFRDITITETGQSLGPSLIRKRDPDIVGISSVTQNFNIAKEIARKIKKESNALVLVGNHHITALPNNLTEHMDVAVLGEGEQTTLELLEAYEENGLDYGKLSKIDGIAYRHNKKLIVTPRQKLIRPLDRIPFPARDLLGNLKEFYMFTSRGCPYRCTFCSSAFFWRSIRYFSPRYVVREIMELVERYNAKFINLFDDLFITNRRRLREIAQLIREKKLHEKVEFACLARANLVDDSVASLLKSMNVTSVALGLESGSDRILSYLKKGSVTVKQNEEAVNALKKQKINAVASFIIGSPSETKGEILQTLWFLERSKLDSGETYVLLPLPGTELWDYGVRKGLLNDRMNWDNFEMRFEDNPGNRVILADKISREELLNLLVLFKKEWSKKARTRLMRRAIRHPNKAVSFVIKKMRKRIK